jgi:sarcosine oxidase, subunit alpha
VSAPELGATPGMPARLGRRPGELIDRGERFTFTWNGREHPAFRGDTITSALAASGVQVFSRSFKYSRPRGILTASYLDPGCTVQVGDEPNVRGSHRRVEPGMAVSAQRVWPSLERDVKAVNQVVGRFLTAGFYYKTFIKPQRLWPAYQRVLQRFAAGGVAPDGPPDGLRYDQRHAHPDVLVAGGGPAGMAAAVAAARAGASVMLVEEEHELGGHLRAGGPEDREALAQLRAEVAALDIEVLTDAAVAGRYDGNWCAVVERSVPGLHERLTKVRPGVLVVAAGLIERPYVVAGNDLPGVMLSTAVRRLINLYAVRPGERAVVLTANPEGDAAVADLEAAGVQVWVEDARAGGDVVRILGRGRVTGVELGDGRRLPCDLVVTATGWTAPTSLLNMAGDRPVYEPRIARFLPARLPDDVLVTGGLAGDGDLDLLLAHARAAGGLAAERAADPTTVRGLALPTRPIAEAGLPALALHDHPSLFRGRTHGFVDLSEDVSSKDLHAAVAEGYDSSELAKRYTTATMGPSQGKLETINTVAAIAEALGIGIGDAGTTTWRPPYVPVTLGALAGRSFEPVRVSPMQAWHEAHGAVPLVAGAWIRPDRYGDPAAEVRAVRERVGLIDVTPIGKLDLQGPDVAELLELLYVNRWRQLEVGRVRYGVMCAEDGVVLDDGVTGRLGEDHYLMSTTSSGAAGIWEWVENWLQTERRDLDVHVTPVTTAYASMNLAGPRSREVLAPLTDVDLAPDAFGYMHVRTGTIAGVDGCVLWRIGFTGELSYELHVPAGYGLHVWEALLAAGSEHRIAAFGIEAQRILRLEKGHFIVGQDTDGLTKAGSAGLGGLVRLDKPDLVGKPELAWQAAAGVDPVLVAIQPEDPDEVPPEASQIVVDGGTVGRITSSRFSPTLQRGVCLGQVPSSLAAPGSRLTVRLPDRREIVAVVQADLAHVDPQGERLRG